MRTKSRAAVFAHYDKDDLVEDYVYFYLQNLHTICDHLVFVTTSNISAAAHSQLSKFCGKIVARENEGHDFMSYKVGLENLECDKYDEIIICNDSVYGPLFPLQEVFDKMDATNCDFWGITHSEEIAYHIQSYFVVFKKRVIQSDCFRLFWGNVTTLPTKKDIIHNYEVGLSQLLVKNSFHPSVYVDYRPGLFTTWKALCSSLLRAFSNNLMNGLAIAANGLISITFYRQKVFNCLNPTHFHWWELITEENMPFIKIDLLRDNPLKININGFSTKIEQVSKYDTGLIERHLKRFS